MSSAGQSQQHSVDFHQVGIDAVKARAPLTVGLFGAKFENGEIARRVRTLGQVRKLLAEIGDSARCCQMAAIFAREHSAQHALIFRVRLAEVKVGHTAHHGQSYSTGEWYGGTRV